MQPVNLLTLLYATPELPAAASAASPQLPANSMEFMLALQQQLWMGQAPKAAQAGNGLTATDALIPFQLALATDPATVPVSGSQTSASPALSLQSLLKLIVQALKAILDGGTVAGSQVPTGDSPADGTAAQAQAGNGLSSTASQVLADWDELAAWIQRALEQVLPDRLSVRLSPPSLVAAGQATGKMPWAFTANELGSGASLADQTGDSVLAGQWLKTGSAALPDSVKWFTQVGAAQPDGSAPQAGSSSGAVQALTLTLADGQVLRLAVQQIPSDTGPVYDLRIELPGGMETIAARLTISQPVDFSPVKAATPALSPLPLSVAPATGAVQWVTQPGTLQPVPQMPASSVLTNDAPVANAKWFAAVPGLGNLAQSSPVVVAAPAVSTGQAGPGVGAPAWTLSLGGLAVFPAISTAQPGSTFVQPDSTLVAVDTATPAEAVSAAVPSPPVVQASRVAPLFSPGEVEPVVVPTGNANPVEVTSAPAVVAVSGNAAVQASDAVKQTADLPSRSGNVAEPVVASDASAMLAGSYPLNATPAAQPVLTAEQLRLLKPEPVPSDVRPVTRPRESAVLQSSASLTTDLLDGTQSGVIPFASGDSLTAHLLQFADAQSFAKPYQGLQYLDLAQRLLDQTAAAKQAGNGLYSARLELNPPNLGQMYANISVRGETVAVQLAMVSSVPKEQLKDSLEALRQSLEQAGLDVVELRIVTLDPEQHEQHGQQQQEQQPENGQSEVIKTTPEIVNGVKTTPVMNW